MNSDKHPVSYVAAAGSAGIAIGTILMGYADLWLGGLTVSALFLTIGYLICVPIALMTVPKRKAKASTS